MLLGSVHVEFEALDDDQRLCRRVSVELLKSTTFERENHATAAVSSGQPTVVTSLALSGRATNALPAVIITLMVIGR